VGLGGTDRRTLMSAAITQFGRQAAYSAICDPAAGDRILRIETQREDEHLKSILLDAIAHDFKSPLTSIKLSVTSLLDDLEGDREQRKELLSIIDAECSRIDQLVEEAMEMARLESDEVKPRLAFHAVGELVSAALEDCKPVLQSREIYVELKNRDSGLRVDLPLAKKVLVDLITNAHSYSSAGKPIRIATEKRSGFYRISVADQGPGIEESEINRIFEKFYRGRNHRNRVQGTGMGLPIAKAIVETHGGTISAVSRMGQGSVFTFTLPSEQ